MTPFLILEDEATIVQPGHKTKHAGIAKELITLPENVELVLIAWILYNSVMSGRLEVK